MSKAPPDKRSAKRKYEQPILTMDERHGNIVDFLKKEAKIKVEELADRLRVSQVTIRKDLDALERRGLLQRSHGNAIFSQQSRFNVAFLEKLQIKSPAKESIAQTAASYVHEGDSIVLDSGTTTLSLAKALVGKFKSLFVITNSVPVGPGINQGRIRRSACRRPGAQSQLSLASGRWV